MNKNKQLGEKKTYKYELWEIEGILYIMLGLQLAGIWQKLAVGYGIFSLICAFIFGNINALREYYDK